jgi:hypothetical protein
VRRERLPIRDAVTLGEECCSDSGSGAYPCPATKRTDCCPDVAHQSGAYPCPATKRTGCYPDERLACLRHQLLRQPVQVHHLSRQAATRAEPRLVLSLVPSKTVRLLPGRPARPSELLSRPPWVQLLPDLPVPASSLRLRVRRAACGLRAARWLTKRP